MNQRVWKSGPPPHVGWWNAMRADSQDAPVDTRYWRWWDGENWSFGAFAHGSGSAAYVSATASWKKNEGIFWTDHWPDGARVPRVDPSLRENCAIVEFINISITSPDPKLWEEAAWKDYHCKHAPAPAAAGSTRTVREMKERLKPMPAANSNGQPPAQIPERREISDPFHGVSSMALMRELFRRFNATP